MLKFEVLIDNGWCHNLIASLSVPSTAISYVGTRAALAAEQQRTHDFSAVVKKTNKM